MTLVGLGLPMVPENIEFTTRRPSTLTSSLLQPPSTLSIRPHSPSIGRVPACFFQLLQEVPKANPVKCLDPTGIIRLSINYSRKWSNDTQATTSSYENEDNNASPPEQEDPDLLDQRLLKSRQLFESRIKSLRLEIGDLSIAENLEKLCDHYFKLDQNQQRSDEFNRKLSMLLNEKCCGERKSCHVKCGDDTASKGHKNTGNTVTFNLESGGDTCRKESIAISEISSSMQSPSSGLGPLFHGLLSKKETDALLPNEGDYLIRHVLGEEAFILSFRCNNIIHNFRLFKDSEFCDLFYLEDRKVCYASLDEMVNEGLRTLFLDLRAGSHIDTLTELAQINKHDSMLSWLTPTSGSSMSPNSRKNSAVSIYVGIEDRRPSLNPQGRVTNNSTGQPLPSSQTTKLQDELIHHCLLPGTINLDKKAPCDLESCPFHQKSTSRGPNLPSGKETFFCRDCGLTMHEKCLDRLESSKFSTCLPDLYKIPDIFGTDLTSLVKSSMVMGPEDDTIYPPKPPFVITKCVEEIERIGLGSEGIYRVPGSQDVVLQMQHLLERDRTSAELSTFSDTDSICGLLKMYLRLLPEPLISRDVFSKFMQDANNNVPLTLDNTKRNLAQLPAAHKITLRYLLAHCDRVVKERESNKMSAYNLSVVLVPSIIAPEEMTLATLKTATDVVDMLIRNNSSFDFFSNN